MKLVSINIQGMHNVEDVTYNLSNFQYFVGPNGAGKSTILQAIQLALLGYIPGTNKTKDAIFRHSNGKPMVVKLVAMEGSEAISISRIWAKMGNEIINNVEICPEGYDIKGIIGKLELPIFNFTDFIGMTANKMKDWFLDFLPAADTEVDWRARLYNDTKSFVKVLDAGFVEEQIKAVEAIPCSGLEQIRQFNLDLKSTLSYKKGALSRVQNTIQSLIFYDDADSGDVDALTLSNKELNTLKDKITEQLMLVEQNTKTQQSIDALGGLAYRVEEHYADKYKLSQLSASIKAIKEEAAAMLNVKCQKAADLKGLENLISSDGKCPYTLEACESISSSVAAAKIQHAEILTSLQQLEIDISGKSIECDKLAADERRLRSHIEQVQSQQNMYNNLVESLHTDVVGVNQADLINQRAAIEANISANNNTIIKLEANKKYRQLTDQLTEEKYKIEENIEMLKLWIKLTDVNGLQSTIMNEPFKRLSNSISAYLCRFFERDDISAEFILSEKSNKFSFGISYNNGDYIEYDLLSSGERCLYTLALLLSLVESSECKLPLIMIDDLLDHLDASHSKALFNSLYNVTGVQVLLAGVSPCTVEAAKEFTIEV